MIVAKTFVFVDLPKCGTTSIRTALGCRDAPNWHSRKIPESAAHLPRFAVVRNPYARALSLYHFERYQCERGRKPEPQAYWQHWRLDAFDGFLGRMIDNRGRVEFANYLPCALFLAPCEPVTALHLESLQADWNRQAILPAVTLPRERVQTYDATLTRVQRRLVQLWAAEDFGRYGYTAD